MSQPEKTKSEKIAASRPFLNLWRTNRKTNSPSKPFMPSEAVRSASPKDLELLGLRTSEIQEFALMNYRQKRASSKHKKTKHRAGKKKARELKNEPEP